MNARASRFDADAISAPVAVTTLNDAEGAQIQPTVDNDNSGDALVTYYSTLVGAPTLYQLTGLWVNSAGEVTCGPTPLSVTATSSDLGDYHDVQFSQWNVRLMDNRSPVKRGLLLLLVASNALLARTARCNDVWTVNGLAVSGLSIPCVTTRWQAETVFHNHGSSTSEIVLVDATNGALPVGRSAAILPGESRTARQLGIAAVADAVLWFEHYSVPPEVDVESRLDLYSDGCSQLQPPTPVPYAKVATPTFVSLVRAGDEQRYYGVDLGGAQVRLNVTIMNAGTDTATARIALIAPFCSPRDVGQWIVTVPPRSATQTTLRATSCAATDPGPHWDEYAVVTVDQPSVSFISSLSDTAAPTVTTTITAAH